jgi:hypothetical protein
MSPDNVRARDSSLRRLRTVNRVVIGGSVLLTGLLSDVAANAFAGHTRKASAATIPATSTGTSGSTGSAAPVTSSSRHRSRHHSLQPPAQAPSPQTATAPTTTVAPQPVAPVVAPSAPVVSGGS